MAISPRKAPMPLYTPRWYQIPPMKALDGGIRNALLIWGRRSGKDIFALNYMAKRAYHEKGVYYYILPTYSQGKKVIWDSITNDGFKMLGYFPDDIVVSRNGQEMKLVLNNGSVFQIIGSKNFDLLMGTNPRGVVFSEHALSDPQAYEFIQPILGANPNSWQIVVSTPRGRNAFYDLYLHAKKSPDWYCDFKTSIETGVISEEFIEKERDRGVSEEHIQQEYLCSFSRGVEGSFYGKLIDDARTDERIGRVPYEAITKVNVSFDLGIADSTCIWFWQHVGREIHFIDYYENNGEPLSHYVKILQEKPYIYGDTWLPHDAKVRELGTGVSRVDILRQLGITPLIVPNIHIADGIEIVRGILPRCWFDEKKCEHGIKCLEMYHKEFNPKRNVYSTRPVHDCWSHGADSARMACVAISRQDIAGEGPSSEEWNKIRRRNLV